MEDLKKNESYCLLWVDGSKKINCIFRGKSRGFLIFDDENGIKVICRNSSLKQITTYPA
jgi:hypothetical protein